MHYVLFINFNVVYDDLFASSHPLPLSSSFNKSRCPYGHGVVVSLVDEETIARVPCGAIDLVLNDHHRIR